MEWGGGVGGEDREMAEAGWGQDFEGRAGGLVGVGVRGGSQVKFIEFILAPYWKVMFRGGEGRAIA
jgi:hypothetical protein